MEYWTNEQLLNAEDSVMNLAEATGFEEKEIVEIFSDGFSMKFKGKLPENINNLIDELRSTFDAY